MRILGLPLLILFLLGSSVSDSSAQAQRLPSIQRIIDRGEIIVGIIDQNLPPMIMANKDGKLSGFDISLARVIARQLDTKVKFVRVPSFNDVINLVATKKADIGVSLLSRNSARAQIVLFSRPYIEQAKTLLINRVRGLKFRRACPTTEQLIDLVKMEKRIGILAGTSHENDVQRAVPDAKLVRFETYPEMLQAVNAGKLTGTIQGEVAARYYLHTNPSANIRLKLCEYGSLADFIGIAVRPDAPDLVGWLNVLLDEYKFHFDADAVIGQDLEKILP